MAHADESAGLEVGREMMADVAGLVGAQDAVAERAEASAPPSAARWTGPLPSSSRGVMAVVDDDGYLIPLWTAGDLLRACKVYWHSASD